MMSLFFVWFFILIYVFMSDQGIKKARFHSRKLFYVYAIAPVLALFVLVSYVLTINTIIWIRFSHAIFILSLWLLINLLFILLRESQDHKQVFSYKRVVAFFLIVAPIIYMTPINHYEVVFVNIPYVLSFISGIIFLLFYYVAIFKIKDNDVNQKV